MTYISPLEAKFLQSNLDQGLFFTSLTTACVLALTRKNFISSLSLQITYACNNSFRYFYSLTIFTVLDWNACIFNNFTIWLSSWLELLTDARFAAYNFEITWIEDFNIDDDREYTPTFSYFEFDSSFRYFRHLMTIGTRFDWILLYDK